MGFGPSLRERPSWKFLSQWGHLRLVLGCVTKENIRKLHKVFCFNTCKCLVIHFWWYTIVGGYHLVTNHVPFPRDITLGKLFAKVQKWPISSFITGGVNLDWRLDSSAIMTCLVVEDMLEIPRKNPRQMASTIFSEKKRYWLSKRFLFKLPNIAIAMSKCPLTATSKRSTENCRDFKDFHEYSPFFCFFGGSGASWLWTTPHRLRSPASDRRVLRPGGKKGEGAMGFSDGGRGIQKSIGSKVLDSKLGLYKKWGGALSKMAGGSRIFFIPPCQFRRYKNGGMGGKTPVQFLNSQEEMKYTPYGNNNITFKGFLGRWFSSFDGICFFFPRRVRPLELALKWSSKDGRIQQYQRQFIWPSRATAHKIHSYFCACFARILLHHLRWNKLGWLSTMSGNIFSKQ